ncbi:MAG: TIGR04086 family membrane protein [Oscillospiraceae bacterium]|nr:TIGR04086 family membrane protein [Oscillospiraceae bacterium]
MKYKIIKSLCHKKYYGIVTAVSVGLFIIVSLVCVCGLCMTAVELPDAAVYAVSCFIIGMGGYISGVTYGKNKRRKGIVSGLKCGLWLWGIVSLFGIVYMHEIVFGALLKNFIFICIPAVAGSIYGVNSRIKRPPF